jgi:hypothetical protein
MVVEAHAWRTAPATAVPVLISSPHKPLYTGLSFAYTSEQVAVQYAAYSTGWQSLRGVRASNWGHCNDEIKNSSMLSNKSIQLGKGGSEPSNLPRIVPGEFVFVYSAADRRRGQLALVTF